MRRIAHSLLPSIVFDITYFQHWAIISAVVYNVWGYIGYKFIQQGIPIVWRVISMFIVSVWKTVLLPSQFTSWTIDRFVEYITTCMTMAGILSKVKVALSWIQPAHRNEPW